MLAARPIGINNKSRLVPILRVGSEERGVARFKKPDLHIIEIDADSENARGIPETIARKGNTTSNISTYRALDVLKLVEDSLSLWRDSIVIKQLNIEEDHQSQEFQIGYYDLVWRLTFGMQHHAPMARYEICESFRGLAGSCHCKRQLRRSRIIAAFPKSLLAATVVSDRLVQSYLVPVLINYS